MISFRIFLFLICCVIISFSCTENNNKKLNVFVSIQPQKFFVEKIGGEKVDVSVFVKSGMSPENFEPLPSQLLKLSDADIYFTMGFQFEDRIVHNLLSDNSNLKIEATNKNITPLKVKSYEEIFNEDYNNKHKDEEHFHGLYDPHTWLSPSLVKMQAEVILEAIINADSSNSNYYKNNFSVFIGEIDSLTNIISTNLSGVKNRNLLVFHPAWGYFCDEFNLKQIPIEIEGKEPGMKNLSNILDFIKSSNSKYILAESQNISPVINSISEETNLKIIHHNPLAENYYQNMIFLSEIIKENN